MAVQFNVPASPKKNVFEIDKFLGVDLTNSGANVDEVRSPNAPNMVRYVPGKVRKRMGYAPQIIVNNGLNINRAKNTSDGWTEIEVTATSFDDADTICEFYDSFPEGTAFYIWLEIEAVGSYRVSQKPSTNGWNVLGTEETPFNSFKYKFGTTSENDVNGLYVYHTAEAGENDYFKVKNIKVFWKTSASDTDELGDIAWRPAPEDSDAKFIRVEDNPAYNTPSEVNGFHSLLLNDDDSDNISNVNRAYYTFNDTYSIWTSFNVNYIRDNIPYGQTIYVQFEYRNLVIASGSTEARFRLGSDYSSAIPEGSGIFSGSITISNADNAREYGFDGVESISIRRLMLVYNKTSDVIEWSEPPEYNGDYFDVSNAYVIEPTNESFTHSFSDSKVETLSPDTGILITSTGTRLMNYYSEEGSLYLVSFTASGSLVSPDADDSAKPNIWYAIHAYSETESKYLYFLPLPIGNHDSETIKGVVYCPAGWALRWLHQLGQWSPATGTYTDSTLTTHISNIELHKASLKTDYKFVKNVNLYHIGNTLYRQFDGGELEAVTSSMANNRSLSWQVNNNLYIADGKTFRRLNGETYEIEPVSEIGKIPIITIGKSPRGGGVSYEPFNLLQPAFIETFSGTETATQYYLSVSDIDKLPPKAWVLDANGDWEELTYGTDFTYNSQVGFVQFTTAPGVSPVDGEDNVKIQAYKTIEGYASRINKCTIGTLFGVNGASDRLFLSGNPDYKNWDFYSEQYDPTYFPDTGYSQLGSDKSAIVGYSKVNNYLAAHKDGNEEEQNVLVREGDLITRIIRPFGEDIELTDPAFKLINTLQGAGAYGKYTFANLQTEPVFLTKSGIYAITAQDLTGEKYGQNRSFYLNGALLKEPNLDDACACIYNDMYVLAVNNKLYILDGLQPVQTDKSMPYATRQYVAFYCTDVPAYTIWTENDELWFGTTDGKICKFYSDVEDIHSYNDDGKAIECCWETPDLDGKLFYKNKTFRYFAVRMMKALRTSCKLYASKLGVWSFIKEDTSSGIVFDFNNIDFGLFSFSTDSSEKVAHTKLRVKKVDKARFKVENTNLDEPFGLFNLALEYIESGNYKG